MKKHKAAFSREEHYDGRMDAAGVLRKYRAKRTIATTEVGMDELCFKRLTWLQRSQRYTKVRKGCKSTQKYAPNSNLRTFEYLCDLDPRSGVNIEAGRG